MEKWHRNVSFDEVWKSLKKAKGKLIWFKMESLIVHVSCKNIKATQKLLKVKSEAGIKRGGVFHIQKDRIQVELEGTHKMEVPVKANGKLLVSKKYMQFLVEEANKKFKRNVKSWKRFEKEFKITLF